MLWTSLSEVRRLSRRQWDAIVTNTDKCGFLVGSTKDTYPVVYLHEHISRGRSTLRGYARHLPRSLHITHHCRVYVGHTGKDYMPSWPKRYHSCLFLLSHVAGRCDATRFTKASGTSVATLWPISRTPARLHTRHRTTFTRPPCRPSLQSCCPTSTRSASVAHVALRLPTGGGQL